MKSWLTSRLKDLSRHIKEPLYGTKCLNCFKKLQYFKYETVSYVVSVLFTPRCIFHCGVRARRLSGITTGRVLRRVEAMLCACATRRIKKACCCLLVISGLITYKLLFRFSDCCIHIVLSIMKAPGPKSKRCTASRSSMSRTRGHAAFMYTVRQQSAVRSVHESRDVSRYLLQRVGSEAARLSCFNRLRIITRREVLEAWNQLRRRRNPAALAGA